MKFSRRDFIKSSLSAGALASIPMDLNAGTQAYEKLDRILTMQVLKRDLFNSPVIIQSVELLRYKDNFICRVRSQDGAEGISISNNMQMIYLYPIHVLRVQPFFIGKDARDLENLLDEIYVHNSNYKLQNLALWIPVATIEFAILDMLGKISGKSIGELIGKIHNHKINVYQANNYRGKSAEESIQLIKKNVENTRAKAVKFKIGGRMSMNKDYPPGRTEKLIPLVRKTFGDEMVIYADSNGSYTVEEAIRIGRILEEYKIDFYEEPVPFDWYEETKQVADMLIMPIAGGEQEASLHNFRWLIGNDALQIVQPDMFYFGGMIRSIKIARMAEAKGLSCIPHISGSGIGYLYMMHFVSAIPNAGPYHEFKGFNKEIPLECQTSSLSSDDGAITVPSGPGFGVTVDPDFVKKHVPILG
jgi:L-alanine-DL-glutamate epimerase-like enolase superfamily enzyme